LKRINQMRRFNYKGMIIVVENEIGSVREGVDRTGKPWKTRFYYPYGYVEGTVGRDGDGVDCFMGPFPESDSVYIIHQIREDGLYDEDKCMLGFRDKLSARDAYLAHFNTQDFIGKITEMPVYEFAYKVKSEGRKGIGKNDVK